jgi:16S rRNA (cytidine1402-2'-O)-methyltransferase
MSPEDSLRVPAGGAAAHNSNVSGTLFVVGTPIGNLEDLSDRARRVLGEVDVVACEDTRRTGRLLAAAGVARRPRLVSHFEGNEAARVPELVELLLGGASVALVTDAGMPGVSDPGYRLVAACVEAGVPVDVVPGPSSVLAALVLSGLPIDRFVFEGFLPRSGRKRNERLAVLGAELRTAVLFESPRRVAATLRDLLMACGDRPAALCRELTKLHQEVIRGPLSEVSARIEGRELKGEVVLVMGGAPESPQADVGAAVAEALALIERGMRPRQAATEVAERSGAPVREIYRRLLAARDEAAPPDPA